MLSECTSDRGSHGKPGRDRHTEVRQLNETGTLAPENRGAYRYALLIEEEGDLLSTALGCRDMLVGSLGVTVFSWPSPQVGRLMEGGLSRQERATA